MKIQIKDSEILQGMLRYKAHPKLTELITWLSSQYPIVITEFYRKKRHKNDLHGTNLIRAIDLRKWAYTDELAYRIKDEINNKYRYHNADQKQCAIIHGSDVHFHIQVHPETKER